MTVLVLLLLELDLVGDDDMTMRVVHNLCFFVGGVLISSGVLGVFAQRAEAVCRDNGCSAQPAGCAGGGCAGKDAAGLKCFCVGKAGACGCK